MSKLCATITRLSGTDISKQGLHQRFNEKGVAFLKGIFLQLAEQQNLVARPLSIDDLFSRIRILDATSFGIPTKDPSHPDGAKIQLEYELYQGNFLHTLLYSQTDSDQYAARELADKIEPGDLMVRTMNAERFECHLYGTLIHILLSSMVAFQCRAYLYQKHQIEGSEYKCIDHAKSANEEDQREPAESECLDRKSNASLTERYFLKK
ncbi:hypothetical protein [Amphibacillus jilinensis]|uniref:hypothetical protein n=1 Tax=Amphibacillus jilinensis TaxID=1216008 RepID=UPI0011817E15|nr:hypothetical protein [Amphibacillus jilinensis]